MSFVQDYLDEKVKLENINDYIGKWHDTIEDNRTIYEFLGFTEEEYARFVENHNALWDILILKNNERK